MRGLPALKARFGYTGAAVKSSYAALDRERVPLYGAVRH